jgi:deoxyribonuclease-4
MSQDIKLGSHVGMSGKDMFLNSVKEAISYGANTFMVYTGAPQNTRRKDVSELNIPAATALMHENGIEEFVVHAPYIINLANTVKPETYELAVTFLAKEIERTAAMRSHVLVLHPGSHVGAGEEAGINRIIEGLNTVLDANDDDVVIALETMAGKGSEIGRSFEQLAQIYDGVHKRQRLRVCFDTCHVNDAGYDLVNHYDAVMEQFDKVLGLNQIAVFHINDSMNPTGAGKDRHANIGKGTIGYETLAKVVHDARFVDIPKILETPWLCEEGSTKKTIPPYKEEIAWLLQ